MWTAWPLSGRCQNLRLLMAQKGCSFAILTAPSRSLSAACYTFSSFQLPRWKQFSVWSQESHFMPGSPVSLPLNGLTGTCLTGLLQAQSVLMYKGVAQGHVRSKSPHAGSQFRFLLIPCALSPLPALSFLLSPCTTCLYLHPWLLFHLLGRTCPLWTPPASFPRHSPRGPTMWTDLATRPPHPADSWFWPSLQSQGEDQAFLVHGELRFLVPSLLHEPCPVPDRHPQLTTGLLCAPQLT